MGEMTLTHHLEPRSSDGSGVSPIRVMRSDCATILSKKQRVWLDWEHKVVTGFPILDNLLASQYY